MACFTCGKVCHILKHCRSKPLDIHRQVSIITNRMDVKPIVCFSCSDVGHKSPQCPNRKKDRVKRILIQQDKIERLAKNDIMATFGDKRIPMTFDSGAQISDFSIELVKPEELMGNTSRCKGAFTMHEWSEGKVANVTFEVGS